MAQYPVVLQLGIRHLIFAAIKRGLPETDTESAFIMLSRLSLPPSGLYDFLDEGLTAILLEQKTMIAALLLVRVASAPSVIAAIEADGGLGWLLQILTDQPGNDNEPHTVVSIVLHYFRQPPEGAPMPERAVEMFDAFVPHLREVSKLPDPVTSIFEVFALAVQYAPEKAREYRLVRMASLLLSVHMQHVRAVRDIIGFLCEAGRAGLMVELVEVEPLRGTVIKALEKWPSDQRVLERGVVLAFVFDHPEKDTWLRAATTQFPDSEVLREFRRGNHIDEA
jgi:hypothetical protein